MNIHTLKLSHSINHQVDDFFSKESISIVFVRIFRLVKSLINQNHIDACQEHVLFLLRTSLMSHSAATCSVKFSQLIAILQMINHISVNSVQRIFFPSITFNVPVGKILWELYRSKSSEPTTT